MDNFDLIFCRKGSDDSFNLSASASTTLIQLFEMMMEHTPEMPEMLVMTTDSNAVIPTIGIEPGRITLGQLGIRDTTIVTYYDRRFEPLSPNEEQLANNTIALQVLSQLFASRPYLFKLYVDKHPEISENLPRWMRDGLSLDHDEFVAWFNFKNTSLEHSTLYWTKRLEQNPNDPLAQKYKKRCEDQQIIDTSLAMNMEHNPESFGDVCMLYIEVTVNDIPCKAFVDSGAQTTIISPDFAKKVGIDHLIDERYAGRARGVGSGDILGKIHGVPVKLGTKYAPMTMSVIATNMDMLLGLDQLKSYQMIINLQENCLIFQGEKCPFLSEGQIPKSKEEIEYMEAMKKREDEQRNATKRRISSGNTTGGAAATVNTISNTTGTLTAPPAGAGTPTGRTLSAIKGLTQGPPTSKEIVSLIKRTKKLQSLRPAQLDEMTLSRAAIPQCSTQDDIISLSSWINDNANYMNECEVIAKKEVAFLALLKATMLKTTSGGSSAAAAGAGSSSLSRLTTTPNGTTTSSSINNLTRRVPLSMNNGNMMMPPHPGNTATNTRQTPSIPGVPSNLPPEQRQALVLARLASQVMSMPLPFSTEQLDANNLHNLEYYIEQFDQYVIQPTQSAAASRGNLPQFKSPFERDQNTGQYIITDELRNRYQIGLQSLVSLGFEPGRSLLVLLFTNGNPDFAAALMDQSSMGDY